MQRGLKPSQLKQVSSPSKVYDALDTLRSELIRIESDAGAGGGATETMTFNGLRADDEIMALSQKTAGASGGAPVAWDSQAADALDVSWDMDPGAGAVLVLMVRRSLLK